MKCQSCYLLPCLLDEQRGPAGRLVDRLLISSRNDALRQGPYALHFHALFEPCIIRRRFDGLDCGRGDCQPLIYLLKLGQIQAESSSSVTCRFLHSATERTPGHSQLSIGDKCDRPFDRADRQHSYVSHIT